MLVALPKSVVAERPEVYNQFRLLSFRRGKMDKRLCHIDGNEMKREERPFEVTYQGH